MGDVCDRANCDLEQLQRAAISHQLSKASPLAAHSFFECEACGEPIPEGRRKAMQGCTRCVRCAEQYEKERL